MNEEDENIWALYAQGVQKFSSDGTPKPEEKKKKQPVFVAPPKREEKPPPQTRLLQAPPPQRTKPSQPETLDVRIERNLSLGDVMIEAKLDLHGKTEGAAYNALQAFVEKQHNLNRRMLLVITGKGKDGTSVLRTNVPRWCGVAPLRDSILAVRTAAVQHGGEGAYYFLLRKNK